MLDFDEQWPERIVCDAAMTNLQFGLGQNVIYDDYTIAEHLQHRLVDQKPHLDVSYLSSVPQLVDFLVVFAIARAVPH